MGRFVRWLVFRLLRLYYPRIAVEGLEQLPRGRVMFVLNHPNGLLDPLLLMLILGQPVAFLAKNTFFNNPIGRWMMHAFGALPIYRQSDAAEGSNTRDLNEQTFARCRQLLADQHHLALFPEGTSHSEAYLLPLRSGAARIALGAEAEHNWQLDLKIVPIGLWYEDKHIFRSSVLLLVGKPINVNQFQHAEAEREQAVASLTTRMAEHLGGVVFQAGNAELLRGLPVMVGWTVDRLRRKRPSGREAYTSLTPTERVQLATLAAKAQRYARTLRLLGIADPWAPQLPLATRWRFWRKFLWTLLAFIPAACGILLSYPMYRLSGIIATRMTKELEVLSTIKLIAGMVLQPIGWIVTSLIIGLLTTWQAGLIVLLLAPLFGFIALRWSERWRAVREATAASWLRLTQPDLTSQLLQRRRDLGEQISNTILSLND
ncbi:MULTISPECIES: 1-acyl-sn-glycerol-3-phosphate acyltransferase [Herpetosiphon]|uniref:1-acyl-sn-glycerol-3-phosphate acyltransferase n=1 Tax=Herpetosiphon TaxID=64 RepID=UPI00195E1F72|nr:1-acyl-sn-glycerol-3-phosphate acyltransferase [Herpetosiphon giganteus]MBM7843613.1 1-acyl-sn-glycerol-3-phosphate acyltransferase [Herpetosiphon giganteus]